MLPQLAQRGFDVNAAGPVSGATALHLAARWGHISVLQQLLVHAEGIDLQLEDARGRTAAQLAAEMGHHAAAIMLQTEEEHGGGSGYSRNDGHQVVRMEPIGADGCISTQTASLQISELQAELQALKEQVSARGSADRGGQGCVFYPPEHLLTSLHTVLIVEFDDHPPTLLSV